MVFTALTTPAGRKIHASITADWALGAALYRIAEIDGTISLGWDSSHYGRDCCADEAIQVTYGKPTESPFTKHYEDPPTVCRVRLAATAVFHPCDMDATRFRWLVVRRETGDYYAPDAPDGTRRRTADIVYTITRHMLAQPWSADLHRAHGHHQALSRLRVHQAAAATLQERINELSAVLDVESAGAEVQRVIIEAGPVTPPARRAAGPSVPLAAEAA